MLNLYFLRFKISQRFKGFLPKGPSPKDSFGGTPPHPEGIPLGKGCLSKGPYRKGSLWERDAFPKGIPSGRIGIGLA